MSALTKLSQGKGLTARALRSSALTVGGFGLSQVIRLATNLILTRLLFPEAFGMMALVSVVLVGLGQFSDVGIGPSIMQSKRGDDPDFLNTAWSIQVIRGVLLWLTACALAHPAALLYEAPELAQLLPVAGLALLITGFNPTRIESAHRHMQLGRLTLIDIATQIVSVITAVIFAWWLQSVWALVFSGVLSTLVHLGFCIYAMPGLTNRFRWQASARRELIHFGKWIFLSTVCGFLFSQSDKIVIGKYLSLGDFGVYNIGFFLASFPLLLGSMLNQKIVIPIYRECPPLESRANFLQLRRMRMAMTFALIVLVTVFSGLGVWLINFLYDPRYAAAGAVVVLLAIMQIPTIIQLTYDQAALAAGDSRRFFVLTLARAALMIAGLVIGLEQAGLYGAIVGQGIARAAIYPVTIWLARRVGAWDPVHDGLFAALGLAGAGLVLWLNKTAIMALAATGAG
ncbi:MAG: oligosaccharide flippase family protein [Rhodobacteraceae bacterium]|nr:oligosaccharide flippase family protein [Paracoccaceae bacterium]